MSEGTMLDYETHIRPGCKLLNPNTLCDINKEVLPYGKVIFSQLPISHWQNESAPQENFIRLVVELYAVLCDYGKEMAFALVKDRTFAKKTYQNINALRHYFCHGLPPVSSSNHAVNTARRALVSYTGAVPREGVISPTPEEWANGVEALRTESNKLADALLQSAERVKNYPSLLSVPWEKRWSSHAVAEMLRDGGCDECFMDICRNLEQSSIPLWEAVSWVLVRTWQDDKDALLSEMLWKAETEGLQYWYENVLNATENV